MPSDYLTTAMTVKTIENKTLVFLDMAGFEKLIDNNGKTELFNSNDNDMILDSIKMKSSFFKYGIITKIHPELENRAELEQLIE